MKIKISFSKEKKKTEASGNVELSFYNFALPGFLFSEIFFLYVINGSKKVIDVSRKVRILGG